ncbi:MAG: DMT family transporter [Fibrobacter sp.]|nr:DMT family transporter [Fibrobacter sp.]
MALWHVFAVVTILFWGTSFVSTKVLINHGFSAVQIFTIRFAATYLILLLSGFRRLRFKTKSLKDELFFMLGGITGCTIYFWTENTALTISQSSNVSLIVCTNPLLILLAGIFIFKREKLLPRQIAGSFITFAGMVLVILNGKFILRLSPVGDMLAFCSALAWTVYAYSTEKVRSQYPTIFAIRKIFFYGFLTSLPILFLDYFGFGPFPAHAFPWHSFQEPVVIFNFLCLCIFSNFFGYLIWNKVMDKLGTVLASNYIFAIPLVTMITAAITIGEHISIMAVAGAFAIVTGMIMAEKQ